MSDPLREAAELGVCPVCHNLFRTDGHAFDCPLRLAAPSPEAGLREAGWNGLIDDLHAAFDQGHMRVASIVDRWRPMIDGAALASPADPPSEPVEYTPSGLRYPTLDELNGGPVRTDLPMLRPADPDMEERLREDLRAIYTAAGWTVYLDDRSGRSLEFLAARLIAQGWQRP